VNIIWDALARYRRM